MAQGAQPSTRINYKEQTRLGSDEGFLFNRIGDCDVSYFGNDVFLTREVQVSPFKRVPTRGAVENAGYKATQFRSTEP